MEKEKKEKPSDQESGSIGNAEATNKMLPIKKRQVPPIDQQRRSILKPESHIASTNKETLLPIKKRQVPATVQEIRKRRSKRRSGGAWRSIEIAQVHNEATASDTNKETLLPIKKRQVPATVQEIRKKKSSSSQSIGNAEVDEYPEIERKRKGKEVTRSLIRGPLSSEERSRRMVALQPKGKEKDVMPLEAERNKGKEKEKEVQFGQERSRRMVALDPKGKEKDVMPERNKGKEKEKEGVDQRIKGYERSRGIVIRSPKRAKKDVMPLEAERKKGKEKEKEAVDQRIKRDSYSITKTSQRGCGDRRQGGEEAHHERSGGRL